MTTIEERQASKAALRSKSHMPANSIFYEKIVPLLLVLMGVGMLLMVLFAAGVLLGIIRF